MITFPSKDKREIVAVYQNNVLQYNTARKTSTALLKDISFSPTTMTSDYGYLAVGGQRSQVIIRQLNSNWYTLLKLYIYRERVNLFIFRVAQTAVGGAINNSLVLSKHSEDDVRLMVCNNDQTIKIFSVPNMNLITTLNSSAAVNNVGVSPDGKIMAVVGDSNQIQLHSISSSNEYKKLTTLTGN